MHEYVAVTTSPTVNAAPVSGAVNEITGAVRSILIGPNVVVAEIPREFTAVPFTTTVMPSVVTACAAVQLATATASAHAKLTVTFCFVHVSAM